MRLPKTLQRKVILYAKNIILRITFIGILRKYFLIYFETFSVPTADSLFLLILSIQTLESAHSIRFLYEHCLFGLTEKSLTTFYYGYSYTKVDYSSYMNTTARISLKLIPLNQNLVLILKMFQNCFVWHALHTCLERRIRYLIFPSPPWLPYVAEKSQAKTGNLHDSTGYTGIFHSKKQTVNIQNRT